MDDRLHEKLDLDYKEMKRDMQAQLEEKVNEVEKLSLQAILAIAHTIDAKDTYTNGHSIRVAKYSIEIARRMGLDEKQITSIYYMALLHDIGKIGIPDAILGKPSKLTNKEYDIVKHHTTMGYNILKEISLLPNLWVGARYHHERYDGKGYPDGLIGENIPLAARIIGVADAFDAMTSKRAYRNGLSIIKVQSEVYNGREKQFDPLVADILLEMIDEDFQIDVSDYEDVSVDINPMEETTQTLQKVIKSYTQGAYDNVYKDQFTGIWNRAYATKNVDEYLKNPLNRGMLFMLDLDNFKSVNDIYGHGTGDEMIMMLADTIREVAADVGIPARMGGDEFIIFFPNEDNIDYMKGTGDGIIKTMANKIAAKNFAQSVSVSIGIASTNNNIRSFEKLYAMADKALYYVKEHGKGFCYFFEEKDFSAISSTSDQASIAYLKKMLNESRNGDGAFQIGYDGFTKIYQFIARRFERTKENAVIILFNLEKYNGGKIDDKTLDASMKMLETAICSSIRKGDVTTKYSGSQQIVMLMNTDVEDGEEVMKRITRSYRNASKSVVKLSSEISLIC